MNTTRRGNDSIRSDTTLYGRQARPKGQKKHVTNAWVLVSVVVLVSPFPHNHNTRPQHFPFNPMPKREVKMEDRKGGTEGEMKGEWNNRREDK